MHCGYTLFHVTIKYGHGIKVITITACLGREKNSMLWWKDSEMDTQASLEWTEVQCNLTCLSSLSGINIHQSKEVRAWQAKQCHAYSNTTDCKGLNKAGWASHCKCRIYCPSPSGNCFVVGKTCVWRFHVNQDPCYPGKGSYGKGKPKREDLSYVRLHKRVN